MYDNEEMSVNPVRFSNVADVSNCNSLEPSSPFAPLLPILADEPMDDKLT